MWNRNESHDVRTELFGGYHSVRVWNLPIAACPPFTVTLACELEPAGTVGVHVQQDAAELVHFLEGEGVAVVDGVPRSVLPGCVVALPFGSTLALENASPDQPLRYLITKARAAR
jgi:uncharacterized cupin superfamily protein